MRAFHMIFATFLPLSLCCATSQPHHVDHSDLDILKVQKLSIGKSTTSEVSKLFGRPDQVVNLKRELSGLDAWTYKDGVDGEGAERLSFIVAKNTGIVVSATWIPRKSEGLYNKDSALAFFKNCRFSAKSAGSVAQHYYLDDVIYSDLERGVSIYVYGNGDPVKFIAFDQPSPKSIAKVRN